MSVGGRGGGREYTIPPKKKIFNESMDYHPTLLSWDYKISEGIWNNLCNVFLKVLKT